MSTSQNFDELHRRLVDEQREQVRTRTGMKRRAQEVLLQGIAVAKGYWDEQEAILHQAMTPEQREEFDRMLQEQADRVARLFGYEEAWNA